MADAASAGAPTGETIVVVEDEDAVLRVTTKMLEGRGYKTLSASNGPEALALCRDHKGRIDLVMTDMIMPLMTGREFIDELSRIRNDFKVLFLSGYGVDDTVDGETLGQRVPFLQKPFTRAQLTDKIREVLDG